MRKVKFTWHVFEDGYRVATRGRMKKKTVEMYTRMHGRLLWTEKEKA